MRPVVIPPTRKVSCLAARTVEPLSRKLAAGLMANPRPRTASPSAGSGPRVEEDRAGLLGARRLAGEGAAEPPGVLLVDLEAGGAGVTRREDRRRGVPASDQRMRRRPNAHLTTAHSARSL